MKEYYPDLDRLITPIKWGFTTQNKSVISYLPRCSYHLLYHNVYLLKTDLTILPWLIPVWSLEASRHLLNGVGLLGIGAQVQPGWDLWGLWVAILWDGLSWPKHWRNERSCLYQESSTLMPSQVAAVTGINTFNLTRQYISDVHYMVIYRQSQIFYKYGIVVSWSISLSLFLFKQIVQKNPQRICFLNFLSTMTSSIC